MHNKIFILTLLQFPRIGRKTVKSLLDLHNQPVQNINQLKDWINLGKKQGIRRLYIPTDDQLNLAYESAQSILVTAEKSDVKVLDISDSTFPHQFRCIPDPPIIIYAKGSIECLNMKGKIAVVGTRNPSEYGLKCAERFGFRLAEKGVIVVSGLALGCDTAAHVGCLKAKGKTIAVLAHGLDTVSPTANKFLANAILDGEGSLISEYPIGIPARRNSFVDRNRLQVGLSEGLIVVETDLEGGTMNTINACIGQQKPMACLDHPQEMISHPKALGNQALISQGKGIPIKKAEGLFSFIKDSSISQTTE